MNDLPVLSREFLESHRGRADDDTIADYIAAKQPAFREQLSKIRQASGNDPRAVTGFLNWRIYGDPKGVQQEEKGFFGRVGDDLKKRISELGQAIEQYGNGERSAPEVVLRALGRGAGAVTDVIDEGVTSAIKYTPEAIKEPIRGMAEMAAESAPGQAILSGVQKVGETYGKVKEAHPRLIEPLEDIANIASLYPGTKAAQIGLKSTKQAVKQGAKLGADALESGLESQAKREALDIIAPKLTKTEKVQALAQGRGKKTGLLGNVKVQPSAEDLDIADAVQNVVKRGNNPFDNVKAIRGEIAREATAVEEGLKKADSIFNEKTLRSYLSNVKEESRVIFGTDRSLEAAYDAVVDEMLRQVNKGKKKLSGLLTARKEFDKVIEQKFPNLLSGEAGDNIRKNAVFDVRRAANQFIADQLPDGNPFKQSLLKQTRMYRAIDNIAGKAVDQVDTNLVSRALNAIKRNQAVTTAGAIGVVGLGSGLIPILSNPLVLGTLAAGGTYKIGKKIVTSQMVRKALMKTLRTLEGQDKKAVRSLIDAL